MQSENCRLKTGGVSGKRKMHAYAAHTVLVCFKRLHSLPEFPTDLLVGVFRVRFSLHNDTVDRRANLARGRVLLRLAVPDRSGFRRRLCRS